jgi:hypothetical protein
MHMSECTTDKPPDDDDKRNVKIIERFRFEGESLEASHARYVCLRNRGVNLDYLGEGKTTSTEEFEDDLPIVGILSDDTVEIIEESRKRDENVCLDTNFSLNFLEPSKSNHRAAVRFYQSNKNESMAIPMVAHWEVLRGELAGGSKSTIIPVVSSFEGLPLDTSNEPPLTLFAAMP